MTSLLFHRDGGVTAREHGEPDRRLDENDPLAILTYLRSGVVFEPGLTSAQLMRGLLPWSDVLSRLSWCDFGAWAAAVGGPHLRLVGDGQPEMGGPALDAVVISPTLHARRTKKSAPSLNVTWDTSGRYAEPTPDGLWCGLSMTPLSEWAHLPLLLETRLWISDIYPVRTNPNAGPMLNPVFSPAGGEVSPVETWPSFFKAVCLGFLDEITALGNPSETEETADMIRGRLAEAAAHSAAAEGDAPG